MLAEEVKRLSERAWIWWYVSLFPLVVLLFLLFIGSVPFIVEDYKNGGKVILALGILVPLWTLSLVGKLLPDDDPWMNRGWSLSLIFMMVWYLIWLGALYLAGAGWLGG